MTQIRLKFVHEYLDRHGKLRRYFRRPGFKRIRLPGIPGSEEFNGAYQLALAGQPQRVDIGAGKTKPGTVNAAVIGYYSSLAFRSLAAGTQKMRRSILERFREQHGDKRIALLPREFIVRSLGKKKPFAARNWLKTLRGFMEFVVAENFRADDPTQGIKLPKARAGGFHTWTDAEIAQYEERHQLGTQARLAMVLLLYTAQSRDVVEIGPQHVRNGEISLRRQKTGASRVIPLHPELDSVLRSTPCEHLTYLVTKNGKPFTRAGFGNWFRDRCNEAGLPHCTAHGLRKAISRRLAEGERTAHQIAAITGHKTLREVERYTKAADQAKLARQAFAPERRRTDIG